MRVQESRRPISHLALVGEFLMGIALVLAPLMAGSVHAFTNGLVLSVCLAGLWCMVIATRREGWAMTPLVVVLVGVLLCQALTLVPLPEGVLPRLSPILADVLDDAGLAGVALPRLSYTPGATTFEIVKLAGAIAAFLLALQLGRTEERGRRLVAMLGVSAIVVLLVSAVQTVGGAQEVLGIYRPISTSEYGAASMFGFRTPFINPNHAAEFLGSAGLATLAFGLFLVPGRRLPWLALGIACLGCVVLTGSGGGMVSCGVGLLFLVGLWLGRRRRIVRWPVPVAAAVALAGVLGVVAHAGLLGRELPQSLRFDERMETKTRVWPETVMMTLGHPWTGVGRGGFRDAVPRFQQSGTARSHSFVENEYLQITAELGLPVAVALLLTVGVTWAFALARWRGSAHVAAGLCGTFVVGLHSFVDFGLEFAGVGLPFLVLLALVAAPRFTLLRAKRRRWSLPFFFVPAFGLLFLAQASAYGHHHDCVALVRAAPFTEEGEATTRTILRSRPASADVALAIAEFYARGGDFPMSLRWLGRTMFLSPQEPTSHALAARTLASMGAVDQALLELKLAFQLTETRLGGLYSQLADLAEDTEDVSRALGQDAERIADFVVYLLEIDAESTLAREVMSALLAGQEGHPSVVRAEAELAMADGRMDDAVDALQRTLASGDGDDQTIRCLSRCLTRRGDVDDARSLLERAMQESPEDPWLVLDAARVEIAAHRPGPAKRLLRQVLAMASSDDHAVLGYAYHLQGDVHRLTGDLDRAGDDYRRALALFPERHVIRIKLGDVYRDSGSRDAALREYRTVRNQTNAFPQVDTRIEKLLQVERTGGPQP